MDTKRMTRLIAALLACAALPAAAQSYPARPIRVIDLRGALAPHKGRHQAAIAPE